MKEPIINAGAGDDCLLEKGGTCADCKHSSEPTLWIGIEGLGGLVSELHFFTSEDEAEKWHIDLTGFSSEDLYPPEGGCADNDYDQTKIFVYGRLEVVELVKKLLKDPMIAELVKVADVSEV